MQEAGKGRERADQGRVARKLMLAEEDITQDQVRPKGNGVEDSCREGSIKSNLSSMSSLEAYFDAESETPLTD